MQKDNLNPKLAALQAMLTSMEVGLTKLAAMVNEQPKRAAAPTAEIQTLAETLSLKLASIGVGTVESAPFNAAQFASDHQKALRAMTEVASYLAASTKTAEAPATLGRPATASSSDTKSGPRSADLMPRIRC